MNVLNFFNICSKKEVLKCKKFKFVHSLHFSFFHLLFPNKSFIQALIFLCMGPCFCFTKAPFCLSHRKTHWTMTLDNLGLQTCLLGTSNFTLTMTFFSSVQTEVVSWSVSIANHSFYRALGRLHNPWCNQPLTRFVFQALQLLPIRFTQRNLCCVNTSTMKHQHNPNLPWFLHGYQKGTIADFLKQKNTWALPTIFIIKCEVDNKVWRRSPISLKHIFFYDVCCLILA